jgi:isoleucyl-tRNA synthetase
VLFATWYDGLAPLPAGAVLSADDFERLLQMREAVSKVLEPMRADGAIGASLEAEVEVLLPPDALATFAPVADELRFFFITSRLDLKPVDAARADAPWIHAVSTTHGKCVRCWHYRPEVGTDADDPDLCARCIDNVRGAGETRRWF